MSAWSWPPPVTPPAPSNPAAGEIWAPPSSGLLAISDEFSSTTLDPSWRVFRNDFNSTTFIENASILSFGTPIDMSTFPAVNSVRASLSRRSSWLQVQPGGAVGGAEVNIYWLIKPITPATNQAFWTRVTSHFSNDGGVGQAFQYGMALLSGGATPDLINGESMRVLFTNIAATNPNRAVRRGAGSLGTNVTALGMIDSLYVVPSMLGIQKVGNSYWMMHGDSNGNFGSMSAPQSAGAFATYLGIFFAGVTSSSRSIYSFDFVRSATGIVLPL